MKIRFIRSSLDEMVEATHEVFSISELYLKLRDEKSLSPDFDISAAVDFRKYHEYMHPQIAFAKPFAIYLAPFGHIGFADSDLKSVEKDFVRSNPQNEGDVFYVEGSSGSHYWNAKIMRRRTPAEKKKGLREPIMYLECQAANAHFICASLNAGWKTIGSQFS